MDLRTLILSSILAVAAQDLELDKRDWIDPTDMLNYDTVKRVMKKPVEERTESKQSETGTSCDYAENQKCEKLMSKLQECEQKVAGIKQGDETFTYREEMPFMKRYINQLMEHFTVDTSESQDYRVTVHLTTEDKLLLKKFVVGEIDKLQEVDEILSRFIINSEPALPPLQLNTDWAAAINVEFFIVVIILSAAWIFVLKASLFKCGLLFVIINTFWNWKRMYQEALAHREAELAKLVDIPSECRPNEPQSLFYKFGSLVMKSLFGKDADACEKYHKAMGVDPIWQVSPGVALSETIAQFLTHPLGVLGSNIGTFYYNLNENVPWFSYYILLIASLLFGFFFMVAMFKYRIRLPFGIVSIEPAPAAGQISTSPPAPALTQPPQVRQVIQEVANQPQLRQSAQNGVETLASVPVCRNCQCNVKPIQVKQTDNLGKYAVHGAGDQRAPVKRENLQEINKQCLNDDKSCPAGNIASPVSQEAGDNPYTPFSRFSMDTDVPSLPTQLSPKGNKFLSDLCSTLQQ